MYRIYMFDGLILPELIDEGGGNDIGTGDAMTSFTQLPGGGFFDNYGAGDSPQNIRPITRNCVLFGATTDELYANFTALRGKIGKRGRLTVAFDNGQMWWQWARLQKVSTPRNLEARVKVLKCGLTFTSASQQWYGLVESGDTWSVGDESFYLGDGSAALGMNEYSFDIGPGSVGISPTLVHAGNTFARNLQIAMITDQSMSNLTVSSEQGQTIAWNNPGLTGAFTLLIDTGAKSCYARMDSLVSPIFQVRGVGATVLVQTSAAHGLATGDSVEISGTEAFNGIHHDVTVVNTTIFTYPIVENPDIAYAIELTGNVSPLVNAWTALTVNDRKNWFMLYPGSNRLSIAHFTDGSTPLQSYQIQFSWYSHYK